MYTQEQIEICSVVSSNIVTVPLPEVGLVWTCYGLDMLWIPALDLVCPSLILDFGNFYTD